MRSAQRAAEYSFDTSALIDPWRRLYPPIVFPGLWDAMAELMKTGAVIASDTVHDDLRKKHGDDLHDWVVEHASGIFRPDNALVQREVGLILRAHPQLVSASHGHSDPFVIAHAIRAGATVVTNERKRSMANPKIPDVCGARKIECITPLQLMEREGWRFA